MRVIAKAKSINNGISLVARIKIEENVKENSSFILGDGQNINATLS